MLRKNILLIISYDEYTKHVRSCPPLPVSVTFSVITVSVFIFLTLTPHIPILFTVIPQRIISPIHCPGYTALLKTRHSNFCWGALPCCYDPYWLKVHYISWFYKLTWTNEYSQFSPQMVLVVLRILNTYVLEFCVVLLWFLICALVQVLFSSLVVNF
jgi:hypothetical protein